MSVIFVVELMIIALIFNLAVRMVCLYNAPHSLTTKPITCKRILPERALVQSKETDSQSDNVGVSEKKAAIISGPLPTNPLRPVALVSSADAGRILESYIDDFLSVGESSSTVFDPQKASLQAVQSVTQRDSNSGSLYGSLQEDLAYAANS